ncbi:MAG: type II secretion system F family protein [Rhodomicrobium sp.]
MSNQTLVPILIFFALLMFLFGLYVAIRQRVVTRGRIQNRLQGTKGERIATEAELFDIRQSRSLTADGYFAISIVSLNKLILQSGTSWGLSGVIAGALACAAAAFLGAHFTGAGLFVAVSAAIGSGMGLPILVLRAMRDGRQRKFEEQLPDAIDTLVRGLKAGHAVSVAVSSVAHNLSDPIGAEFRLTAAEMTYGLDLETAMTNLHTRVGQPDLGLVALAVSMQSKTGGNLADILANLSRVIRERFKLRRKAHALSAEGRFSALVLSALPVLLFCVIWFLSPDYYRDVWDKPYTKTVLAGAGLWMCFGNYIMYRMVRIRV